MSDQKKLWILAGMISVLGLCGCTSTGDTDVGEQCNKEDFVPYCLDGGDIQVRCSDNGMIYQKICAGGCQTYDSATDASVCLGEYHCDPVCEEGYWCDYDVCKPGEPPFGTTPECTTNADCKDANKPVCDSGTCVPAVPECTTNADCKDASKPICNSGICVAAPEEPECETTDDCDAGEVCQMGACVSDDTPEVEVCGTLTIANPADVCERTGSGSKIVLRGDVLGLTKTYEGGSVVIENGQITYVGCEPTGIEDATVITCPTSVISPGLLNGHEHLTYSNNKPGDWGTDRFDHRHNWRKGQDGHDKVPGPGTNDNEVVELRALMSGTTAIFGSGNTKGLTRSLDKESVGGVQSIYQTFPLGDSDGFTFDSGCDGYKFHNSVKNYGQVIENNGKTTDYRCPYGPHIAEGINQAAYNELVCLSSAAGGGNDIFWRGDASVPEDKTRLAIIHGIAATPAIVAQMAQNEVSLVWSARTNVALYGDTAAAPLFDNLGVNIALGTDWIYSGSANMLRELQCVDYLNRNHYNSHFSDYAIWRMPTYNTALALGVEHVLGQIKVGHIADIAMYQTTPTKRGHRAVIDAENKDVLLVMMDGKIIMGNENIMTSGETVDVCGVSKKVDTSLAGTSLSYSNISSKAAYPLFFCETPNNEPSCVPARVEENDTDFQGTTRYDGIVSMGDDSDGDGIKDNADNCPTMFNPIRPMDTNRKQADFDGDGLGDICDSHPTCATNDDSCPVFNTDDRDSDGVDNLVDNCPDLENMDQADTDGDGMGDACDACPEDANPGGQRCPVKNVTTIQTITQELAACNGSETPCNYRDVLVEGRVTAIVYDGFIIQDPNATDTKWSAIHVDVGSKPTVAVNDDVKVQGIMNLNYNMAQLKEGMVTVVDSDNEPIKATAVPLNKLTQASTDATKDYVSGADAVAYTSVLVKASGLTAIDFNTQSSDYDAATSAYKYGMYLMADGNGNRIRLDDYAWTIDPKIEVGQFLASATGILVYDYNYHKIAPRSAADLIAGLGIASMTSNVTTAEWGSDVEITVTMNQAVETATTVNVACGSATCDSTVVVPAGSDTVTFTVKMADAGDTTVTASYDATEMSVTITGVDPAMALAVTAVSPETVSLKQGNSAEVKVTLNKPANADTTVTLTKTGDALITVPETMLVAAGSMEGTFQVTADATAVPNTTAAIAAAIGDGNAATVQVTIKDVSAFGNSYTMTFENEISTGYAGSITTTSLSGADGNVFTLDAKAHFSMKGNGYDYTNDMVMTSNTKNPSHFTVSGLDGVGKINIEYLSWSNPGSFEVTVGDDVQKESWTNSKVEGVFEYVFEDENATMFKLAPPTDETAVENGVNRVVIKKITWTTNN